MSVKKLLGSIFAGIGAVFLLVAVALVVAELRFERTALRSTGEVVGLRRGNKGGAAPDIAFTAYDGQPRLHRSSASSSPPYELGDRVSLLYDPADPDSATIDTFVGRWLMATIFGGIGLVDLTLGSTFLLLRARRKREIAWLLREGQRLSARVVGVEQNFKVRVNRKHPWFVRCEATLPGESAPRAFKSRLFLYDPTDRVAGRTLPVHYDPKDPARHVVDTSDLPTRL